MPKRSLTRTAGDVRCRRLFVRVLQASRFAQGSPSTAQEMKCLLCNESVLRREVHAARKYVDEPPPEERIGSGPYTQPVGTEYIIRLTTGWRSLHCACPQIVFIQIAWGRVEVKEAGSRLQGSSTAREGGVRCIREVGRSVHGRKPRAVRLYCRRNCKSYVPISSAGLDDAGYVR